MATYTSYAALADPAGDDILLLVDVSDDSMSPNGTTKQTTVSDLPPVAGGQLAIHQYTPASQTSAAVSATTFAAFDSTNLTISFTAPASGNVKLHARWVGKCSLSGSYCAFAFAAHGSDGTPVSYVDVFEAPTADAMQYTYEAEVTGLTAGNTYQYDLVGACTSTQNYAIMAIGTMSATPTLGTGGVGGPVLLQVLAA